MHTATARPIRPDDAVPGATIFVAHGTMFVEARILDDIRQRHHVHREGGRSHGAVVAEADGFEYRWKTLSGVESSDRFAPAWAHRVWHTGDPGDADLTSTVLIAASARGNDVPHVVVLDPDGDLTVPVADWIGCHSLIDVAVPGVTDPADAKAAIVDALTAAGIVVLGDPTPRPYTDQRVNTYRGWEDERRAVSLGVLEVEAHSLTGNHIGIGTTEYLPPGTVVGSRL